MPLKATTPVGLPGIRFRITNSLKIKELDRILFSRQPPALGGVQTGTGGPNGNLSVSEGCNLDRKKSIPGEIFFRHAVRQRPVVTENPRNPLPVRHNIFPGVPPIPAHLEEGQPAAFTRVINPGAGHSQLDRGERCRVGSTVYLEEHFPCRQLPELSIRNGTFPYPSNFPWKLHVPEYTARRDNAQDCC